MSSEREPLLTSVNSNIGHYTQSNSDIYTSRDTTSLSGSLNVNKCKRLLAGIAILIFVLIERIAYYSLTGNLYLFLNQSDFHWMYYNAMSALLIFTGTSYLSSLFGGWLSDAYLGRFKTISLALFLFTAAYWFLPYMPQICNICTNCPLPIINPTSSDFPLYSENCSWVVMVVLIFAAIGTGTVKANITPFGAEQVRYSGPDGLRIYLNWLYWCVNIGALTAILGITYVQQENGFQTGYLIPVGLLTAATILFLFSYPLYTHHFSCGSPISRIFSVLRDAWKLKRSHRETLTGMDSSSSIAVINRPSWLDMAKVRYGGKFHESVVEDVKSLSAILIVFVILIPYWMLYFQMQSTFLAQGLQMRLSLSPLNTTEGDQNANQFSVPAAWLMLFNVLFLIIFIPLMNHVIYPCLDKRGIQISILTRMAIGMACATLSMVMAGCLEICRLHFIHEGRIVNQTIENTVYVAADLPILWQIPQYSLIGISEVFTSVSGMEFAVSQAPSTMQGAVMGLYYFCTGIGSFVGVAALRSFEKIVGAVIGHHSSDMNTGNLFYYFFFLAAVQFITLIVFCISTKKLKVRRAPSPNLSASGLLGSSSRTR